jgi:hypothetical protein
LRALGDGFDMNHFLTVPILDRTDTYSARDAEDVIAVACSQKAIVGIPVTLCELELRRALAIGIDGLFLVEIDAVRHEL